MKTEIRALASSWKARLFALMLPLCGACAGPVPVSVLETWDLGRSTGDPSPEAREILDEAFAAWELEWVPDSSIDGSLELTFTWFEDGTSGVHGFGVSSGDCDKSIAVEPDALLLAHEIGHVFGLEEHHEEPGFVLSHPVLGWEITDDQLATVGEVAEEFSRCR